MTTKKPDGGGAFPAPKYLDKGLSMRDYFAAQALQGMLARSVFGWAEASRIAYQYADAMLAEREKP